MKIRKLAKVVLEQVYSERERGAGSWQELSKREPLLIQKLCEVLKGCRRVRVCKGEVWLAREEKKKRLSPLD